MDAVEQPDPQPLPPDPEPGTDKPLLIGLEHVPSDNLWAELARRSYCAVLLTERPGEKTGDDPVLSYRYTNSNVYAWGLVQAAEPLLRPKYGSKHIINEGN